MFSIPKLILIPVFFYIVIQLSRPSIAANFTSGIENSKKFGVHEIVLTGNGGVANPFNTAATVIFTPNGSSSRAKAVHAFFDGGNTWRARCYVSETGAWTWSSTSTDDSSLNGKSGSFQANVSSLPGMLKHNSRNPHMWMTDSGKTFIHIADTAYRLFSGESFANDWQEYVSDDAEIGINGFRCMMLGDWNWNNYWEGGMSGAKTRPHLAIFQRTDTRLKWLLNNYPEIYVQLIIFVDGLGDDDTWHLGHTQSQREKMKSYIIDRFAAYPGKYWEVTNDTLLTPESSYPHNWFWALDVGDYFKDHDPWQHLMAFGHRRDRFYPFCSHGWSTYIVGYTAYDIGCDLIEWFEYFNYSKHVYNTEDFYEQYYPPSNPRYFFRRLVWAYLLSGASITYGGIYNDVVPYRSSTLSGLDSFEHIRAFFETRNIDLALFSDGDSYAAQTNAPGPEGNNGPSRPQCARRGTNEFIIYSPNAIPGEKKGISTADTTEEEISRRNAAIDSDKTPVLEVNLGSATGTFFTKWYRPVDGQSIDGGTVTGGSLRTFTSPWKGQDVVLHIYRNLTPEEPLNLRILP